MKYSIIKYKNYYIFPLLTRALIVYGAALKVNLAYYIHYWRGIKKVGKTILFRDLIEKLYNGDLSKGLLIGCGNENGFKALDGLFYDTAENWDEIEGNAESIDNCILVFIYTLFAAKLRI